MIKKTVLLLAGLVVVFGTVASANFDKGVSSFVVKALDKNDPYEPLTFHANTLWVGINRKDGAVYYELQAYRADGKALLASAKIPHTLGFVYPFGTDSVIVVGKKYSEPQGWLTYFTTAKLSGNQLQTKTTALPMEVQTEHFAGNPNQLFFTEVGDRKIFQYKGGVKFLSPEISGPGWMKLAGQYLFVLERRSFQPGDEDIVRIDLKTQKAERVFNENRNFLSHMELIQGTDWLAVSESNTDQVHLINVKTNKVERSISVPGTPSPVSQLGHCLAVVSHESKALHFFDLRYDDSREVATWDLSVMGDTYKAPRDLAIDPATGNAYLRVIFRPEYPDASTGVIGFEQAGKATFAKCQ